MLDLLLSSIRLARGSSEPGTQAQSKGVHRENPYAGCPLAISEINFGTMCFAFTYSDAPDHSEAIRVVRGTRERGVTFSATAEAYGP